MRFSRLRGPLGVVCFFALVLSTNASANIGEAYGFGSRTASLSGANVAWGFDGYASYTNPAGLSLSPNSLIGVDGEKRLILSWGLISADTRFLPIDGVVIENQYTSGTETVGNVDNSYKATFGQALGITYRLFPNAFNFTIGLTSFVPIQQSAYMDTGETFVPEYVLYRSRTQRPQFEMALGADLGRGFHAGAGLHIGFGLTGNAQVMLQADSTKPSTIRFASSLKPKAAPYFGFLWLPDPDGQTLSLGAVLRFPVASDDYMVLRSGARLFGDLASLDFNFTALSAMYYDPWALELGASWQHSTHARLYTQVDFQAWNGFQAPALQIQSPSITNCDGTSCGVNISSGKNPTFDYTNIVIPRIGEEFTRGRTKYRFGYAYRPSFIRTAPTDAGNYLDPPKHMFNAGVGFNFSRFLAFDAPCKLDFHLTYHQMVTQHIDKTSGDESGNTTLSKIGAPGYDAGGKILGGGVSLTLAF